MVHSFLPASASVPVWLPHTAPQGINEGESIFLGSVERRLCAGRRGEPRRGSIAYERERDREMRRTRRRSSGEKLELVEERIGKENC
jgi:hypothetical protein